LFGNTLTVDGTATFDQLAVAKLDNGLHSPIREDLPVEPVSLGKIAERVSVLEILIATALEQMNPDDQQRVRISIEDQMSLHNGSPEPQSTFQVGSNGTMMNSHYDLECEARRMKGVALKRALEQVKGTIEDRNAPGSQA
jgi:hypothetical protein